MAGFIVRWASARKLHFLLFGIAILIRLAVIAIWRFDGLYGQDAYAYYEQALAIAERLPRGSPPPADFFWPNGYPLLAALFIGVLGSHEYAAQLASLLCGAALAPLVYELSRDLSKIGHRVGIWAGLVVALAGQPLVSSLVIMADIPALFWATLAAWLLVRTWPAATEPTLHTSGRGATKMQHGYLLLAGVALGLAVVTRWVYALLAVPFAAYGLYQSWRGKVAWPFLLPPILGGLVVLLPQVWLSLDRPGSLMHSWLVNWRPSNAFARQFEHIDGHYFYPVPVGLYYLQPLSHPNYMVPVLGLTALWGVWHLWREGRQAGSWGPLILVVGWLGAAYLFLAGIPYENFRFGLTLYLPAVLLAGVGVEALRSEPPLFVLRRLRTKLARRVWEQGIYVVVAVCLLGMSFWAIQSAGRFLSAQNQSKAIARQVASVLPKDATLLAFDLTLTLQHYTDLKVVEFYSLDEETLNEVTAINPQGRAAGPVYLLLNVENVTHQWQDRPPEIHYTWLRTHRALTPVADFPPYSLFLISQSTTIKQP